MPVLDLVALSKFIENVRIRGLRMHQTLSAARMPRWMSAPVHLVEGSEHPVVKVARNLLRARCAGLCLLQLRLHLPGALFVGADMHLLKTKLLLNASMFRTKEGQLLIHHVHLMVRLVQRRLCLCSRLIAAVALPPHQCVLISRLIQLRFQVVHLFVEAPLGSCKPSARLLLKLPVVRFRLGLELLADLYLQLWQFLEPPCFPCPD
mmetsp:Transcript_63734/g.132010  ORF Transcript_63734/g.132010 Transcript_63734/m.132010 type:complete len:206 (+) Transcript_63734:59-676(+)